jgi:hypothetical protein
MTGSPLAPRGRPVTPRPGAWVRWVVGAMLSALLAGSALSLWRLPAGNIPRAGALRCPDTASVAAREVARLQLFQGWLQRNGSRGYVGEVGWPATADAASWAAVARTWYAAADRDRLSVTAWSAAQWWPPHYPMAAYRLAPIASDIRMGRQASIIESHPPTDGVLRGVDLPSGAFHTGDDGVAAFSNAHAGRYGVDYYYESAVQYRYLASRRIGTVRLSFRWERLQPRLGEPLDTRAVSRLRASVRAAVEAGLGVVLDLHNFGGYWAATGEEQEHRLALGSRGLPTSALADLWRRLSAAFAGEPGIAGYGLMNEPRGLSTSPAAGAGLWEQASQQAVDAVRAAGDRHPVLVEAYAGSAPEQFLRFHPRAWVDDPDHAVRYEAHQYFDLDSSGRYTRSFAAEQAITRHDTGEHATADTPATDCEDRAEPGGRP